MKYSGISKLLLTALAAVATASDVVQLTGENFEDFVSENALVMAEFFAPWCGHCKALAPEYEAAATTLKESGIPIAKIDCTEEEALCSEQKIQGYPTIKVFKGLDIVTPYQGARKADSIVSYMIRQSLPVVSDVNDKNVDEFSKSAPYVVLGFFDEQKANNTFTNLAESLREKFVFGGSTDAKLAEKLGVKGGLPALVIFKDFDDKTVIYDSKTDGFKFSQKALKSFVSQESFPVIGEVGPTTFSDYSQAELPLLYLFVSNDEERAELEGYIKPLTAKLKGKAHIGFLDAAQYGSHAVNVNLKEQWPAAVFQDFVKNLKYAHTQESPITKKTLAKFVNDFAEGKLEPSVKSEAIPETQDEPVYHLVGKEYESVVLGSDKDVLVKFYAPWCGHCKNLAPIYDDLGSILKDNDKVVIAKLDHTLNEVPLDIRGYPTLKLFKAGDKENPIDFTGERTLEGLATFIKEQGTYHVDALALKAEADEKKATEEAAETTEEVKTEETDEQTKEQEDIVHEDL
jgi:protein disulfide-isomerase A1